MAAAAPSIRNKACLVVIDGWGCSPEASARGDAIRNASTPVMSQLAADVPYVQLAAHGLAVGLPEGLMGNSEVGHLNIGAGRVVYQDIVRIDLACKNNEFGKLPNIATSLQHAKNMNGRFHILGLVSDGGVHSHITHLFGLVRAAQEAGIPETYIHFFADGRDTAPKSATKYLRELLDFLREIGHGKLATVTGRYYAMDRDKRWERIDLAVKGLTVGGEVTEDVIKTVETRYGAGETDEFLKPILVDRNGLLHDQDTLFFFDFRADRMRQICTVFGVDSSLISTVIPKELHITAMTSYKSDFPFPVAFPPQTMDNVLAEWLSKQGLKQCHVAETEKYAHVTFFFNGGREVQFQGEDRDLIPSPKVATYDLKPEMSSAEVEKKVCEEIASGKYDFVMCNFAPPDMVGHTGIYEKTIHAVEATDAAIGSIYQACQEYGYCLFVTSDHGNAEKMVDFTTGEPHTAHTTAPVPFIMASKEHCFRPDVKGALCDVAPTVLEVMGLPLPKEMTGNSLLLK